MVKANFPFSGQLPGIFLAFLGRGPRALWVGNFIGVKQQIGKNSQMKMFLIFCKGCLKVHVVILRNKENPDERKIDDNY